MAKKYLTSENFAQVEAKFSNVLFFGITKENSAKKGAEQKARARDFCVFCNLPPEQIVATKEYFLIAKNKFPYAVFESLKIANHLMIIPRRHVLGLNELSREEFDEFREILQKYEKLGYSIYARAPQNINKTVAHQHTHILKTGENFIESLK